MCVITTASEIVQTFAPLVGTVIIVIGVLSAAHVMIIKRHKDLGNERVLPRQIIMLALTFIGVIATALALPVSDSSRNQIIALIGLVLSGIFAFSSSTIFSNIMAGTMLRVTKPFKTGDYIHVGDFFGRVVERGLLDTEIQTEHRELVAIPNVFLISHPISVTLSSGCIVTATVSLGYDQHHATVESLLIESANNSGLEDTFVQIQELGDFSVNYKVSGVLKDVKSLLTARSNLRRSMLDMLHAHKVDIVSPTFMNQRVMPITSKSIPAKPRSKTKRIEVSAEAVGFDKAERTELLPAQRNWTLWAKKKKNVPNAALEATTNN